MIRSGFLSCHVSTGRPPFSPSVSALNASPSSAAVSEETSVTLLFVLGAAAADKIAVGIRAAACTYDGIDIIAVSRSVNNRARIVAARKYGGSRLVSADYTADGRGSADGAGIVAVLNNARSPVLTGNAADIARSSADSAAVVASAHSACSVNASDNTANIRAAGDIRLVAAVRHLSCGEFSDDSRSIRRTADLTANDEIAYLTAVYFAEKDRCRCRSRYTVR